MTIRVAIQHKTHYRFDRPVKLSPHVVRLRPAPHSRTHIHSYSLKIEPEDHFINWQQDAFGNYLARLVFPEKTTKLSVDVEVIADMTVINPFDFFLEEYAEHFPFKYPEQLKKELQPYLETRSQGPLFKSLVAGIPRDKCRLIDFLVTLNQKVHKLVSYTLRFEPGIQTPEETLKIGTGSCRDSGWLLVQILRHLGLAARFVSGYLVQLTPDEKPLDGPAGPEEDFTDLHAWCEVYMPGAGWVGLDPTSGLFAGEGHIPLACTPDPVSAAPITGFTDECEVDFEYENVVTRILEDPRVTKPYSDDQWADILLLGDAVDRDFKALDVRLTMGGEPTFVSVDDMESEQWNTAALGDDKLKLAKTLLLRLRDHFAPQGLLHYGQGKWYPGEEVPRWALGLFWRKDGQPLWRNPNLLARIDKDYGHDHNTAKQFAAALASKLGIAHHFIQAAYEDSLHYLLQEQKMPANLDPLTFEKNINNADAMGRKRLARILQQGLDKATGFVLPLERNAESGIWKSSRWEFRRGRLILIPGDSPVGLRLPLNDLPWKKQQEISTPLDPFAPRDPLQNLEELHAQTQDRHGTPVSEVVNPFLAQSVFVTHPNAAITPHAVTTGYLPQDILDENDAEDQINNKEYGQVIHTALCIEAREGKLHIFMPPLHDLEEYVLLLTAIEGTASELKLPLIIEGYEPPRDHRY